MSYFQFYKYVTNKTLVLPNQTVISLVMIGIFQQPHTLLLCNNIFFMYHNSIYFNYYLLFYWIIVIFSITSLKNNFLRRKGFTPRILTLLILLNDYINYFLKLVCGIIVILFFFLSNTNSYNNIFVWHSRFDYVSDKVIKF